jgi:RNA polymerase sigma factor (sigma-70 family)
MLSEGRVQHLSSISTCWTLLQEAGNNTGAIAARDELVRRYGGAVYAYLRSVLAGSGGADDVYQEFWTRFFAGSFKRASPERGRFRDYVKTVLRHLVREHLRKARMPLESVPAQLQAREPTPEEAADDLFLQCWREDLLAQAWRALAEAQRSSGTPFHSVLNLKAGPSKYTSTEIAERLSQDLDRTYTPGNVRVILSRAREQFADFLYAAVASSLDNAAPDQVADELRDLGLWSHCRSAAKKHGGR